MPKAMKNLAIVPAVPEPPEGRLLHYELLARLGAGGFGDVYEAWDTQLQRKVAIKRLRTHGAKDGQGARSHSDGLLREARLAASLRHPAFVQIHAIEEDAEGHAIVMELVQGRTWRDVVDGGPPLLATALDMVRQLARAMQAAHGAGLVHGDLKPSNLMLEPDGKVRILDLGLAFYEDHDATSSVVPEQQGTIAYLAPECLLGARPTRQSDVYAAGVILYELAVGERPYGAMAGLALAATQLQTSSAQWTFPAEVPADVAKLVRAMTARDTARRMAGMREVVQALDDLARGGGPAPVAKQRRLMRENWHRWRGWRPAVAVASLTALVAVTVWHGANGPSAQADVPLHFSTAATIGAGLAALRQPDRPDRLDAAAAQFDAVLARDADNAAAAAGLSLVYSFRYAGDTQDETWLERAAAAAQQALKRDSQLALSHVAQAWVLSKKGPNEAALAEAERALALDPGDFFAAVGKAIFLTRLRRFDEARTWIAEASARHPGERLLADALGTVFYTEGDYAAAEKAFRESIRLAPDSVFAYANLNAVLLHENRRDEALGVLQQGLRVRPSGVLYTNLGNALFLRGDYGGAVDAFRQAVTPPAGNPNNYLAWANLADALMWIPGRAGQARDAYGKARQLLAVRLLRTPDDVALVSRMSLYSARVGAAGESVALLKRAVQLAPTDAYVHFRAGLAYELLGRRAAALAEIADARSRGYPVSKIEAEPDLVSLRHDARYQPPPTEE
jgi:serine/threonine-protein kinase